MKTLKLHQGTGNQGKVLVAGGDGTAASWQTFSFESGIEGTLPVDKGGTGATTAEAAFAALAPAGATKGDIMYYDGTKWTALAKGTRRSSC